MSGISTGILLPETILGQPWFRTFALFVAFNTIVYLGLTLSKLVPWPAQFHPDRVRAILPSVKSKDTTMKDIPRSDRNDPSGDFVRRRQLAECRLVCRGDDHGQVANAGGAVPRLARELGVLLDGNRVRGRVKRVDLHPVGWPFVVSAVV